MKQLKIAFIILSILLFNLCMGSTDFIGYYPKGCKLNNVTAGIAGTCTCIQDVVTHDIWLAVSSESGMSWDSTSATKLGANGWILGINQSNTCGIHTGWKLPTQAQLQMLAGHDIDWFNANGFIGIDPNGDYWGALNNDGKTAFMLNMSLHSGIVYPENISYDDPHAYALAVHYPVTETQFIPPN
ncbi:MAG: hypothetical protein K0R14_1669 [Burkholderiales bacterium]|jgi:hypothetical protein|nr:hypothetical protein [Burkholderiales bacterium]